MSRVAIIGAGLSGLTAARLLHDSCDVTVFEKSRGFGGRMATRYAGDFEFDHGAQFFTARSTEFKAFLTPLLADGVVDLWRGQFVELHRQTLNSSASWDDAYPHYVGVPRMNAIACRTRRMPPTRLRQYCTEYSAQSDAQAPLPDFCALQPAYLGTSLASLLASFLYLKVYPSILLRPPLYPMSPY